MDFNAIDTQWSVKEEWLVQEKMAGNESLFSLANGYLGVRGTLEGNSHSFHVGTYLNGFYDTRPIEYDEAAFGLARNSQTMLNIPDARNISFFLDDEPFDLTAGNILRHGRILDLKQGLLFRETEWKSPSGKSVIIESQRLVSFTRPHLMAVRYSVRPLQEGSTLRVISFLDGTVRNLVTGEDPRTGSRIGGEALRPFGGWAEGGQGVLRARTKNSGLSLASAVSHSWKEGTGDILRCVYENQRICLEITCPGNTEEPFVLYKYAAYYHGLAGEEERLEKKSLKELKKAQAAGFEALMKEQETYLFEFWQRSDVKVAGDPLVQQSLRFNLFHILQSAGKDGLTNIAAKGLTGEGYEGHYFWDTEIYVLPFFIYTEPEIAKKLLLFRHSILPQARARAQELSQKGALFPWRTISGEEASAYFLAGTAQYHINADIAYGLKKYLQVTGDLSILPYAAEILIETARFWVDLGDYVPKLGGAFCINGVTGPDEYTALVNNNYYTNIMARDNLLFAVETVSLLLEKDPEIFKTLARELSLTIAELEKWKEAARKMYLPLDRELGIHPQDDTFLYKAVWNPQDVPREKRPVLLHYHPLVIYRFQILKQADLVLAEFLQGEHFSLAQKRRDFDYYDPLTTGDSSLSPCIQGVMACEAGYLDKAYDYFMRTARIDLDDLNGNVRDGIHTAAMAGTWISLVYGFAGLRDYGGVLRFRPAIPKQWESLSFTIGIKGSLLEVMITQTEASYRVKKGKEVSLIHEGKGLFVKPNKPLTVSLLPELEGIIFDLDGVITDSAEYHFQAWNTVCEELGLPFDREINLRLKGISRRESLEIILGQTEKGFTEAEKISITEKKNEIYLGLIRKMTPADILPGVLDFIGELKKQGLRTALASASRNAGTILRLLGLEELFDIVTDPALIVKGKPDPEQFYMAAELLNLPYRNCVGIEDAQAGIEAIKGSGMFAVGIGEYLHGADWILKSTGELSLSELRKRFNIWGDSGR